MQKQINQGHEYSNVNQDKKKLHLFQPQYWTQHGSRKQFWLPYSAGCIWSYVAQFPEISHRWQLSDIHYWREPITSVLENMEQPDVCGFSCYIWNEQYCLQLADRIKKRWPHCWIVFGGPQASAKYLHYDFIDTVVFAEGEESMLQILKHHAAGTKPPPLYSKKRLTNLDIPSPYLTGVFDKITAKVSGDSVWHAVLETNRGCPYACTFCDWGGMTYSKVRTFDIEKIEQELRWMVSHNVNVIFVADANFGIYKTRDLDIAKSIKTICADSQIEYVNLTYAKFSNEHIFKIASELGNLNRGVTVSVQSMNPDTLKAIKRENLKINDLKNVLALSEQYNITTYTELILGLPLETLESWKAGMCELLNVGQHNLIDVAPASILENAELNDQKLQYGIDTVKVPDYMPDSVQENLDSYKITELNEIVVATNTMSATEMHEAFLYSWCIVQWHCVGYSQILARYLNVFHNISYRTFYDRLFAGLQTATGPVRSLYQTVSEAYSASIDKKPKQAMHNIFYRYLGTSLKIKCDMTDFAISMTKDLAVLDRSVLELQNNFVVDFDIDHNKIYHASFNPKTWCSQPTAYQLQLKSPQIDRNFDNFSLWRRRGWHTHRINIISS